LIGLALQITVPLITGEVALRNAARTRLPVNDPQPSQRVGKKRQSVACTGILHHALDELVVNSKTHEASRPTDDLIEPVYRQRVDGNLFIPKGLRVAGSSRKGWVWKVPRNFEGIVASTISRLFPAQALRASTAGTGLLVSCCFHRTVLPSGPPRAAP